MIYAKVLFPPLSKELLVEVNELIDTIEGMHLQITWIPNKTIIRFKCTYEKDLNRIKTYLRVAFDTYRLYYYDEEGKTETIIHVINDELKGEYRLPLFPEEYKF